MIQIFVPRTEMELSFAKSLLEVSEIPFYVHNEYFGGLVPIEPPVKNSNQRAIMVAPEFEAAAKEVLSEFIKQMEAKIEEPKK